MILSFIQKEAEKQDTFSLVCYFDFLDIKTTWSTDA